MQLPDTFDARTVQPNQGGGAHPVGMFDFVISHTYLQDTKDKSGAMLVVEFTSPAGKIENRYNVVNKSPQAMEIAQKELSALCHAVNIFQVAFPKNPDGSPVYNMAGHSLRGGRGRMEIVPQTDREGKPNGYVEIKKIFDSQGNEPGKAPSPAPMTQGANGQWGNNQPQQQAQPQQNNNWGGGQQQPNNPSQQQANPGWGAPQGQPQQQQPQGGGWQQQPQQGNAGPAPWQK